MELFEIVFGPNAPRNEEVDEAGGREAVPPSAVGTHDWKE